VRGAKLGLSRPPPHTSPRRQHPPTRTLRVLRRHDAAVALASARDSRGRSAGMLRALPRNALTGETAAATAGERSVSGPRFPIGLHGATAAYVANANTNTTMRRVPPGRHILVARDPSASAGDE
jgi:hypothetical protein